MQIVLIENIVFENCFNKNIALI